MCSACAGNVEDPEEEDLEFDDEEFWCDDCDEYLCPHGACRSCEGCEECDPEPEDDDDP